MDVNIVGCIAEYKFAIEAMERGFPVSFPLLNTSVYDCVIETDNGFKKIQIKSVTKEADKVECFVRKKDKTSYTKEEIDYLAIYVRHHDGFYIIKNKGNSKSIYLSKFGKYRKNFNNFVFP